MAIIEIPHHFVVCLKRKQNKKLSTKESSVLGSNESQEKSLLSIYTLRYLVLAVGS